MKSVIAVAAVGIVGFLATAFDSGLEMWAPLIVWSALLLAFLMWPFREDTGKAGRAVHKTAA
jgi:hypothetical protein